MKKQRRVQQVSTGVIARKRLLKGAQTLAKAVEVTYGPHGRTALLDRLAGLLSTKDGATVARELILPDPVDNQGCRILRDACDTVNEAVGDGTTTTVVIASELLKEGNHLLAAGVRMDALLRGMREAGDLAEDALRSLKAPVNTKARLEQVALIACNGDTQIAHDLAEACMAVGKDGLILVEDGHGIETQLEFKEGMEIEKGLASPAFFYSPTMTEVVEGALVAIINAPIRAFGDILSLLECAFQFPKNPLILLAPEVEGEALAGMVINNGKAGMIKCAAVLAPGVGHWKTEYLKDIAALSKAVFVDPAAGMNFREWQAEWFGSLRKATLTMKSSVFEAYPDAHEGIQARIASLKVEKDTTTFEYDRDRLVERIAKLSGGLAVLKVGGFTEASLKERRARVEDALGAVRSALRDGVVPGGGVAYLTAGEDIRVQMVLEQRDEDTAAGYKAVVKALRKPTERLAELAGASGGKVAQDVLEGQDKAENRWIGWDARTGTIRDVREAPALLDPAGVTIEVVRAAISVATTLLTVEVTVAPKGKP